METKLREQQDYDEDNQQGADGQSQVDPLEDAFSRPAIQHKDRNTPIKHGNQEGAQPKHGAISKQERAGGGAKPSGHEAAELARVGGGRAGARGGKTGLYNEDGDEDDSHLPSRLRLRFSRRVMAGGFLGTMIGILMGVAVIAQGPLEFIHFAKILGIPFSQLDDFMDEQRSQRLRFRRLSRVGNIAADISERRLNREGFRSHYNSAGYFDGFIVDPNKVPAERLAGLRAGNLEFTDGGEVFLREEGANFRRRRLINDVTDIAFESAHFRRLNSKTSSRLLRTRGAASFHMLGNIDRKINTALADFFNRMLREFTDYFRSGNDVNIRAGATDDPEASDEDRAATEGSGEKFNESLDSAKADTTDVGIERTSADIDLKAKAGDVSDVLGYACAARAIGRAFAALLYARIVLPLMRFGIAFLSIGSQIMYSGQHTDRAGRPAAATLMTELGAMSVLLHDPNSPWASARPVQAALNKPQTGPGMPAVSRLGRLDRKPRFFELVDALPIGAYCRVNDNAIGGLGISLVTGGFAIELVTTGLSALGIDPVSDIIGSILRWAVGEPLKAIPRGALTAVYAMTGTFIAAADQFAAIGGRVLSIPEAYELQQKTIQDEQARFAKLPLSRRLFDVTETHSLVSQIIIETPNTPSGMIASALSSLWKLPSTFVSRIARTFSTPALAAPYDYEYPPIGFSLEERTSERWADPYDIDARVEPQLADLNDRFGKCFSTTVNPDTHAIEQGETVNVYSDDYKDNCRITPGDGAYNDFTDYRFYLANQVSDKAAECVGNVNSRCEIYSLNRTPAAGGGVPNGVIVGDPYTDSTTVPCAAGTTEVRLDTGYNDGNPFPVRLCSVSNIPSSNGDDPGFALVNSRMSGAWFALSAAAHAAGVNIAASSSFRTMAKQTALWNANPNSTWVAPPGHSSHQAGVALDLVNMSARGGDTCASRATADTAEYRWMRANAAGFGLKQYSAEAWHWDALPAASRCE
jgi:hypothetical protein